MDSDASKEAEAAEKRNGFDALRLVAVEQNGATALLEAIEAAAASSDICTQKAGLRALLQLAAADDPSFVRFGAPDAEACVAPAVGKIMSVLSPKSSDAELQEMTCDALAALSALSDSFRQRFADAGACEELVRVFADFSSSAAVLKSACTAVTNLGHSDSVEKRLLEAGAGEALLAVLRNAGDEATVRERALVALRMLTFQPGHGDQLRSAGAIEAVEAAVAKDPNDVDVRSRAVHVLHRLDLQFLALRTAHEQQDCAAILSIAREHMTNALVQELAWKYVADLVSDAAAADEPRCRTCMANDACALLLQAIESHDSDEYVLISAYWALGNLARQELTSSFDSAFRAFCPLAVALMRANTSVDDLTFKGCVAIFNLSRSATLAEELVRGGAVYALAVAIDAHASSPSSLVVRQACTALQLLASASMETLAAVREAEAATATRRALDALSEADQEAQFQKNVTLKVLDGELDTRMLALERAKIVRDPVAVMSVIQQSVDEAPIQEAAFRALTFLTYDRPDYSVAFGELGACSASVEASCRFPADAAVQACVWAAIGNLASANQANRRRLLEAGACEAVVSALAEHMADSKVAEYACSAVLFMAYEDDVEARLMSAGVAPLLVAAMKSHQSSAAVLRRALPAIRSCSFGDGHTKAFCEAGALDAIEAAVALHPDDTDVNERASQAVDKLKEDTEAIRELREAQEAGDCSAIVAVLRYHPNDTAVLCKAWWVVASTTCDSDGAPSEALYGELGACETAVESLNAFPDNVQLVRAVLAALGNLSRHHEENRERFAAAGACSVLAKAMRRYPDDLELQKYGTSAVALLGLNVECERRLVVAGAAQAVVAALRSFGYDAAIAQRACSALRNVSVEPGHAEYLRGIGAVEVLQAAVATHNTDAIVRERGGSLLSWLNPFVGEVAVAEKARDCARVIALFREHSGQAMVVVRCCEAVTSLTYGDDAAELSFGDLGACELLMDAVNKFADDIAVQSAAFAALGNLASTHESNRQKMANAGAPEFVVDVLNRLRDDARVSEYCCSAILFLAAGGNYVARMMHAGALNAVLAALNSHLSVARVVIRAIGALRALWRAEGHSDSTAVSSAAELLREVLRVHAAHDEIPSRAMQALILVDPVLKQLTEAVVEGDCRKVMSIVKEHPSHDYMQDSGLWAIKTLSGTDLSKEELLGELGACEAAILALETHPANLLVQRATFAAISSLSCNAAANRQRFVSAGVCQKIPSALETLGSDEKLVQLICSAAFFLAADEGAEVALVAAGCPQAIIRALELHASSELVAVRASSALHACCKAPGHAEVLGAAGAVEALQKVAAKHPTGEAYDKAAGLLALLDPVLLAIEEARAAREDMRLMSIVVRHSGNPLVLEKACWAITGMTYDNSDMQKSLGGLGAPAFVVGAIRDHGGRQRVAQAAWAALGNLASTHAENREALVEAGACEALVQTMQDSTEKVLLMEYCCCAVGNLAQTTTVASKLMELGVGALVVAAMRSHSSEVEVLVRGCTALRMLASQADHVGKLRAAGALEVACAAMLADAANERLQSYGKGAIQVLERNKAAAEDILTAIAIAQVPDAEEAAVAKLRLTFLLSGVHLFTPEGLANGSGDCAKRENLIGSGGFGNVYRGRLVVANRELDVAIKRLSAKSKQGLPELAREVKALAVKRHVNVVPVLGVCIEQPTVSIVYPLMVNGSLADHLSSEERRSALRFARRVALLSDVAAGLEYLHNKNETEQLVIHGDLKAANVLLDGALRARLSDFGLAEMVANHSVGTVTAGVRGTLGYVDPLYAESGQLTTASDVYSLGVIILQVVTGEPDAPGLVEMVQRAMDHEKDSFKTDQFCDWPQTVGLDLSVLGCECTSLGERPTVTDISCRLAAARLAQPEPLERKSTQDGKTPISSFDSGSAVMRMCSVCWDNPRTTRFMPCCHWLCCEEDATAYKGSACPICRVTVRWLEEHGGPNTFTAF